MTILSLTVAAIVAVAPAQAAPDVGGAWEGRLSVAGQSIRVVFNVAPNGPVVVRLKPDAQVVVLPGLNHLFQPAGSGLPAEYGQIETTLDPSVIRLVVD